MNSPHCETSRLVDWAHPDFSDPRFAVVCVREALTCRHDGCGKLAAHLVEYTMRRDGWTYEYECGYCTEHLPAEAAAHS